MSRVNLNRSNSVDLSQPQDVPVQSNLASRLRRPRTDSFHNVPAPLSNAPNRSQQAYKEALRYHPKETKRIVAQKTVDRLTQKNLSRNVKETLTQGNKFWNKRRFWDRKGTDIKGKVGLSTPATKLKQLTLHRQRDQLMASINSSKHKLWLLSDKESDRTFFDNVRYGNQQPQIEKLELLREMDVPEDFRLEFKEEFCNQYNQNAQNPIDDPADLNWRMQKDPQVKQQFDSFFDTQFWNRLGNHYRLNDRPEEAQRCLANDSQQWRTDQLAAAKQHVGNQLEESEFHNELTSMQRDLHDLLSLLDFQISTLESRVTRREANDADRNCLRQLKTLQHNITNKAGRVDRVLTDTAGGQDWQIRGEAEVRVLLLGPDLRQLNQVWQNLPASLQNISEEELQKASKPVLETLTRDDKLRIQKGDRLRKLGAVLATAVDQKRIVFAVGKNRRIEETQQRASIENDETDVEKEIERYLKVADAAARHGLDIEDLGLLPEPLAYRHRLVGMKPSDRDELFQKIDDKLAVWKEQYKTLADDLRPKNSFQRGWSSFKTWFKTSVLRRTTTEMGAFGAEVGLAQHEASDAVNQVVDREHAEEDPNHISTEAFVAKDVLHGLAAIKNADDIVRIQKEIEHKKHKMHESKEKLEHYEQQRGSMNLVDKYRSGVAKHYYAKMGDQQLALDRLEQTVATTQITRHLASMGHDISVKAGQAGHVVKIAGGVGLGGAAAAEFTEGLIGGGKAISAHQLKSRLESRLKAVQEQISNTNDPDELESLRFQERTLKDLSDQQERLTNALSSLKGFGMSGGYTMVLLSTSFGIGTAATGVAAPVLLAVFAATAIGLKAYKVGKASHESWKLDRTEDLFLGRGGDRQFLADLEKEAQTQGTSRESIALTRISRGKGPDSKRPTALQLLHSLKWESRETRLTDDEAQSLSRLKDNIETHRMMLRSPNLDVQVARSLEQELSGYERRLELLETNHTKSIMQSPTAQTLRDAYGMSEEEIVAIVDAHNNDEADEMGVQLIAEYQNELTE